LNLVADGNQTSTKPSSVGSTPVGRVGAPETIEGKPAANFWYARPLPMAGAALLVLAAAALSVQRLRRRQTLKRTRALLSLSPSLDLGEGACRGGSLPADGPAASLRARLEEGAIRSVEGGEDG
jgi:hypothetical protein